MAGLKITFPAVDVGPINASTSPQNVVAVNPARTGLILNNTDANDCYIYYVPATSPGTVSTTRFTVRIPGGVLWEMPVANAGPFQGAITVIWGTAGIGALIGTEIIQAADGR